MKMLLVCHHDIPSQDANGWSLFPDPAAGSGEGSGYSGSGRRKIYVAPSTDATTPGNDTTGDGSQATPFATAHKAWTLVRNGFPDAIYFKRGGKWTGDANARFVNTTTEFYMYAAGPSNGSPILISAYGTGARPQLRPGPSGYGVIHSNGQSCGNVALQGIEFYFATRDPNNPEGLYNSTDTYTGAYIFSLGKNDGYTIVEDCKFSYGDSFGTFQQFEGNLGQNNDQYYGYPRGAIIFRRNIVAYCFTQTADHTVNHSGGIGLDPNGVQFILLEGNIFHYAGGWTPYQASLPDVFRGNNNHDVYIQASYNVHTSMHVVRRNIFTWGSLYGVHQRSGGINENNAYALNASGLQFGYSDQPPNYPAPTKQGPLTPWNKIHNNVILNPMGQNSANGDAAGAFDPGIHVSTTRVAGDMTYNIVAWDVGTGGNHAVEFGNNGSTEANGDPAPHGWTGGHNYVIGQAIGSPGLQDNASLTYGSANSVASDATNIFTTNGADQSGWSAPQRSVATYGATLGTGWTGSVGILSDAKPGTDAFMNLAIARAGGVWDSTLTAEAVIAHVQSGVGLGFIILHHGGRGLGRF